MPVYYTCNICGVKKMQNSKRSTATCAKCLGRDHHGMSLVGKKICRLCGRPRPNTARTKRDALCRVCVSTKWGKAGRNGPAWAHVTVADKTAQHPTESWWMGKSRAEFAATLVEQMPRLRLAGSDKAGITAGYREVVADLERER